VNPERIDILQRAGNNAIVHRIAQNLQLDFLPSAKPLLDLNARRGRQSP
jgi:hypothetical protein